MSEGNNRLPTAIAAAGLGIAAGMLAAKRFRRSYDLRGKTVLITGGSRGLGLVLARGFADEGSRIVICARDREELTRAKQDLEQRGAEVYDYGLDMRNQGEVNALVDYVRLFRAAEKQSKFA